jgi:hypothetical protein
MFTLLITWQIIADDTTDVEIIAQLEREYRVVDFTGAHLLDILRGNPHYKAPRLPLPVAWNP